MASPALVRTKATLTPHQRQIRRFMWILGAFSILVTSLSIWLVNRFSVLLR